MQLLLSSGIYHGIATHDPKMIDATIDFAQREGIGKEKFEFQMLFGIRRDLQRQLARDGSTCESMSLTENTGILTSCAGSQSVRQTSGL